MITVIAIVPTEAAQYWIFHFYFIPSLCSFVRKKKLKLNYLSIRYPAMSTSFKNDYIGHVILFWTLMTSFHSFICITYNIIVICMFMLLYNVHYYINTREKNAQRDIFVSYCFHFWSAKCIISCTFYIHFHFDLFFSFSIFVIYSVSMGKKNQNSHEKVSFVWNYAQKRWCIYITYNIIIFVCHSLMRKCPHSIEHQNKNASIKTKKGKPNSQSIQRSSEQPFFIYIIINTAHKRKQL